MKEQVAKKMGDTDAGSRLCDLNWMWSVEEDSRVFDSWTPASSDSLARDRNFLNEISTRVATISVSNVSAVPRATQSSSPVLWCLRRGVDPSHLVERGLVGEETLSLVVESVKSTARLWPESLSLVLSDSPGPVRGDLPYLLMCAGVLPHNSGGINWSVIPSAAAQVLSSGWPGVRVSVAGAVSPDEPLSSIGPLAASLWSSKTGPLSDAATALSAARTVCC